MGLKEIISNHPVIIFIGAFGLGGSVGWQVSNEVMVEPREYEIRKLKEEIITNKKNSNPDNRKITSSSLTTDNKKNINSNLKNLGPITIKVIPNIDLKKYNKDVQKIRKINMLRPLTAMESDKKFLEIPHGTYFYLSDIYLRTVSGQNENIKYSRVKRFNQDIRYHYELHYIKEGSLNIIGFISDSDVARTSKLDGLEKKSVLLFPYPLKNSNNMAVIPLERILSLDVRDIEIKRDRKINVLDLKIR